MAQLQSFVVENEHGGMRVDKYLATCLPSISRTKIKHLIECGNLKINNLVVTEPKYSLKYLDKVSLQIIQESVAASATQPKQLNLNVLKVVYEDKSLLIINKPAKLLMHPGAGNKNQLTLVDYLMQYCPEQLSRIGGEARPGIVHRLDMETSGLIVVAKNDIAHAALSKMFEKHSITRKYKGICIGCPVPKIGRLKLHLRKSPNDKTRMMICAEDQGKLSITNYRILESYMSGKFSMIEFQLQTGRTHQIRVHMEYKRTPIVGDKVYGKRYALNLVGYDDLNKYIKRFPRHALHSYYVKFDHPISGEALEFEAELPKDLQELVEILSTAETNQ